MQSEIDNLHINNNNDYNLKRDKETVQIIISQISLLVTSITQDNFVSTERRINSYLEKSIPEVTVKYWQKLLILSSKDIKLKHDLFPKENLVHRLLTNLFNLLPTKNQEYNSILNKEIFNNLAFQQQSNISIEDIKLVFKDHKDILQTFNPESTLSQLTLINELKMNNQLFLQHLIKSSNPSLFENQLTDALTSLSGESLNDMIALLLSELLSPGTQNLQELNSNDTVNSWFTPTSIQDSNQIGNYLSNAFKTVSSHDSGSIDWNRIFNLMSTKYFLSAPLKASLSSLSCIFSALKNGNLIDQFLNCDWNTNFKLILICQLHKWNVDEGCLDLLNIPKMRKVSDRIPNSKNSLLYLMSIASLDLELFLLRDEITNSPLLPEFQEGFFKDFSTVPEYLYLALINNMKHFTLLIENRNVIDEIIVTLLVQVFEKKPQALNDLFVLLPNKNKLVIDLGKMLLSRKNEYIASYLHLLLEQQQLNHFLTSIPFNDSIELFPMAMKIGWSGFEQLIDTALTLPNVKSVLNFLDSQSKLSDPNTEFQEGKIFSLSSIKILFRKLNELPLPDDDLTQFEELQYSLILAFPRIINLNNGHDQAILANGDFTPINSDVEKEMQSYLQRMYSGELAIKDVVEILRKLKESDSPRDQDVFACIIHAVLAECSFFKDYPLEALATTSVLFGSMVLFHLFNGFILDVALRKVLSFAMEGPDSKMFKFAIQAIYAFRIRLVDFPQYCRDLLQQVPAIQSQTQVYHFIIDAAQKGNSSIQKNDEKSQTPVQLIPLKYFNVGEWRYDIPQENPPKEITEKLLFIVNNLTMDNFERKIPDLKEILQPAYFSWFSNYLVNQRAKTEPNYHSLYARIITSLMSNDLHDCIVNITLRQLYMFLGAQDTKNVDKKLLKNLALWLGIITLANDKPIRHKNIAFREMLLEAFKENRLDIVVPFVTRVLQNAAESKIFRPPNPWTVGILKLLLELNNKANWKLSLTFEVEVLFKAFKLSMKSLEPTSFIEAQDIVDTLAGNLGSMSIEQQQLEHQRQGMLMQQYQQHMMMLQQRQQRMLSSMNDQQNKFIPETNGPTNETPFSALVGSTIFVTHPDLKRIFQMALAKSVREILIPAVEKSSNIAVVTTSKIVVKDFATEADENKLKAAAITMVRQLAKSLARATSIEPLKEGIRSTTQSLTPNLVNLPGSPMEELDMAINENVGFGLSLIEEAAMDRATREINEQVLQAIAVRRYHKERRSDQPFVDPNGNPYSFSLPDPLGLKNTGVTQQQFRIYEEFGQMIPNMDNIPPMNIGSQPQNATIQNNMAQNQNPMLQQNDQALQAQARQNLQPNQLPQQLPLQNNLPPNNVQSELEQNHRVLVHLMDVLVAQIKENADKQTMAELGEQNQIKNIIFQILTFIARSPQKDQLALKVAQAVVNSLFATSESSLCREVLSLLLEKLCSLSLVARKDVIWWLVYALDSRKFDVPVIRSLLEVNLIDAAELDTILVTAMKQNMENSIEFSINLLNDVVLSDTPLLMRMDFVRTLEYLGSVDDSKVTNFLQEYENKKIIPVSKTTDVSETEKFYLVFTEWVKLLQRVDSSDKITLVFIRQLIEKSVLSDTDNLIKFIKAALELSVFSFKESDPTGEVFTAIEALSKLIIKLMVVQDFKELSRKDFLNIIFSIVLLVFSKDHQEDSASFNERPYFRLLSNLFFEWTCIREHNFASITDSTARKSLREFDNEFYNISAAYLHSLQPFAFPGFAFAWVSLISHRMFLPIMLSLPEKAGWKKLMLLLIDLFKFLDKYTKKGSVSDAISVVYKGTLRVILGVSNDFPEFLVENHYELMNNLPCTYFQLRNVILSAIPKQMLVPNPYDSNLDMSSMELCQTKPDVFYDPVNDLVSVKKPVDNYLRIPSNSLLRTIINAVYRTEYDVKNGIGYDFLSIDSKLIRAIVLHVGIEAGVENETTSSSAIFNPESSYYALLFNLINDGTSEVKFQVLQVMIEQLRYPNIHTYWFSYVLLHMFSSKEFGNQLPEVQEIILRCLLERVIVNKPHPWGVTVLFSQLLRQPEINLLELEFVKNVPEVENIMKMLVKHTTNKLSSSDRHSNTTKKSTTTAAAN